MKAMSIYCDKCGSEITLEPSQSICLGRGKSYDLCLRCYDKIAEKLAEVDKEIFDEDEDKYLPNKCINCPNFSDFPVSSIYDDSPVILGSCKKAMKNFISVDPYNQTPSWCPKKKETKNE